MQFRHDPAPLLIAAVLACTTATVVAAEKKPPAPQSLFNGKDLSGWKVQCKPKDAKAGAKNFWRVDRGTILADSIGKKGHDYVWLLSDKEYADFVLRMKFQVYRDAKGNTGVQIRSRYDDKAGWLDGPQVDIHPKGLWRTGMVWDETRGSKRWLWPKVPKGKWVNPKMAHSKFKAFYSDQKPGWNDFEITAIGTKLQAVLNGVPVMEYDGTGVLDDANHRKHNVGMKGHIALQIHRGDQVKIRFKDITIREVPPAKAPASRAKQP